MDCDPGEARHQDPARGRQERGRAVSWATTDPVDGVASSEAHESSTASASAALTSAKAPAASAGVVSDDYANEMPVSGSASSDAMDAQTAALSAASSVALVKPVAAPPFVAAAGFANDEVLVGDAAEAGQQGPQQFHGACAVALVTSPLLEPMVYLSAKQSAIVARLPALQPTIKRAGGLPCWVSATVVGEALGHGPEGVARAVQHLGRPYLWATEFENVHSLWRYREPEITVDNVKYPCSETYYHSCKPQPFSADAWDKVKSEVMEVAVRAKLAADPSLGALLLATDPHPLLSIKNDTVWGFHSERGGENRLAEIWMRIRAELVARGATPHHKSRQR
jgi:predicted NAD-dependent protein-ADP-ribosyltransferase YbiA (DUF1768 family)